jgi:hypothetical protein
MGTVATKPPGKPARKAASKPAKKVDKRPRDGCTQEIVTKICARLAEGESLRSVCNDPGMPARSVVYLWLADPDKRWALDQYTRAKELGLEALADDIVDISDDARNDWMERRGGEDNQGWVVNGEHVQRSKLRVEARKWLLAKLAPKKYGDRTTLAGDDEAPIRHQVAGELTLSPSEAYMRMVKRQP